VHSLLGPPLAREANHDKHGAPLIIEDWLASDNEKVTVWFKQLRDETEYRVDSIRFWQAETAARVPVAGTAAQVVNNVASVVDRFYLAYYCPKVYQRPLI
jgi:hypothetical protein